MTDDSNLHWAYVADRNLIPRNEGKKIVWGDRQIALFNLGEEFLAVDARCPHKQGPLADGIVAGKAVFCPLHNWKIDLISGCALAGGQGRTASYPVKLEGDQVFIGFETVEKRLPMKEVMAILRPSKWAETKRRLTAAGIFAFTQRRVDGHGRQRGLLQWTGPNGTGTDAAVQFIPKRLVIIIVPEMQVPAAVNALIEANQTGSIGDGKIFVSPIEEVIQVRTGRQETRIKKFKDKQDKEAVA